jgi:3-isopropylmalate dehydratase, large subunit
MGMTITEKILAAHSGNAVVKPGQIIIAKVDLALANDITAPLAIEAFRSMGAKEVFDKQKVVLVPDHFQPAKDIDSATECAKMREFARDQKIKHFFEIGRMGIEHVLLPEQGLVAPGEIIIGADSHTCTYGALGAFSTGVGSTDLAAVMALGEIWLKVPESIRIEYRGTLPRWVDGKDLILHTIGLVGVDGARYQSMEFVGAAIDALSMDGRFTMANMAIEAGAKNGIFHVDQKTEDYLKVRLGRSYQSYRSDPNAVYARTITIDVSKLEPQVALPHLPSNVKGISQIGKIEIDQVVIGSCTNGRIEDLKIAAEILKGKKAHPRVRLLIVPGSQEVYLEALRLGYIETFIEAEAAVTTATCGPCLGGHMGVLAAGERALATTNRNFVGRMGHTKSEVYLAGPAVSAASAIAGRIISPDKL